MKNKVELCCCSCKHNIRSNAGDFTIDCHCEIDGHYIGYVACFEDCCEQWEMVGEGE